MNGYSILMLIFGIMIILMGIYIYTGHTDLIPRRYYHKGLKTSLKDLGSTTIIVGFSPILSGLVSLFIDIDKYYIIPVLVLIISAILGFIIAIKRK